MGRATGSSLRQLEWITGGGALLTIGASLVLTSPWGIPDLRTGGTGMSFVASPRGIAFFGCMALALAGALGMWRAQVRLGKGLAVERWTSTELDGLRRRLELPVWAVLYWIAVLLILVGGVLFDPRHTSVPSFWVILLFPMQTLGRMRAALRPPKHTGGALFSLNGMRPIQSEHWGER